jgi:hypothetical protein
MIRLGADVRVYDPTSLPMKDGSSEKHAKVCKVPFSDAVESDGGAGDGTASVE